MRAIHAKSIIKWAEAHFDEVVAAAEESMFGMTDTGFCVECGAEVIHCDPDTHDARCETCGELGVFGATELLNYISI